MINAEDIAREALRGFFNDPNGFTNMKQDLPSKNAIKAVEEYLKFPVKE